MSKASKVKLTAAQRLLRAIDGVHVGVQVQPGVTISTRDIIEVCRENGRLRKALFSGENDDGTVDLSVAAHVSLLNTPWAKRRAENIQAVQSTPTATEEP